MYSGRLSRNCVPGQTTSLPPLKGCCCTSHPVCPLIFSVAYSHSFLAGALREVYKMLPCLSRARPSSQEQIQRLQRDHSQEMDRLKRELESAHAQMSRLQQEADAQVLARGPSQPQEDGTARSKNLKEWPSTNGRSLHAPIEERSSGEV